MRAEHNFMHQVVTGNGLSSPVVPTQSTYSETVSTASDTWNINHGLGGFVVPQILDSSDKVVHPDKIVYVDDDNINVIWPSAMSGMITCVINTDHQYSVSGSSSYTISHGLGTNAIAAMWSNINDPVDGLEKILVYPTNESNSGLNDTLLSFDANIDGDVAICNEIVHDTEGATVTDFTFTHNANTDCICVVVNSLTFRMWPDEIVRVGTPMSAFDIEGIDTSDETTAFNAF